MLEPSDELSHPSGDDPLAFESWYFDFTTRSGDLGGYVRIGLMPNLGRTWYWACVVGEDRPLVTVIDHEVPLPSREGSLEIRSEGLWADHTVETPFEHFTLGAEAFAVGVDDPTEVYDGELRGHRVPFGLDLEWETDGGVYPYPGNTRYEIPCTVHGEVLLGDEVIDFDGVGQRDHSWGVRDWWSLGWCWTSGRLDDGTRFHGADIRIPGLDYAAGYVASPGEALASIPHPMRVTETVGDAGLPTSASIDLGLLQVDVTPVAWSPVLLTADDGRASRFPRCLTRFTAADGRRGVGWTEWNQPPR
ncbi:MAG TPA: hypothetical protein VMW08_08985 [Acidimicrobiales bacterium]|nr:hypothetical protein [Acidimicrobiales bacterium]